MVVVWFPLQMCPDFLWKCAPTFWISWTSGISRMLCFPDFHEFPHSLGTPEFLGFPVFPDFHEYSDFLGTPEFLGCPAFPHFHEFRFFIGYPRISRMTRFSGFSLIFWFSRYPQISRCLCVRSNSFSPPPSSPSWNPPSNSDKNTVSYKCGLNMTPHGALQ